MFRKGEMNVFLCSLEDNMHQTSLHFAILKGNYHLAEYLITLSNINVCIRNKHGE
jgi:ankyrin repeat protein